MVDLFGTPLPDWEEAFKEFWSFWPYKKALANAERAYRQLYNAHKLPPNETLRQAVEWQAQSGCLVKHIAADGHDTRPHCSTWLNGRRWEDEREVTKEEINRQLQEIRRTPMAELSLEQVEFSLRHLNLREETRAKMIVRKLQILAEKSKAPSMVSGGS
jgi:hypothetical protein